MLLLCCTTMTAQDKMLAFPGAEGFGRFTTGGRGGKVYHVTNLNDSGTGSLRWANSQSGPRTIVFDVSGTIMLKSALRIAENTTIAGQTAPGDGICIANYPVTLGKNNIIRYVRFRLGNAAITEAVEKWAANNGYTADQVFANSSLLSKVTMPHEGDGLGAMDSQNIIVDHCSVSWSIDECLSVYGSKNITVQWCISAQSLVNAGHSKGNHGYGGNWGGSGASYHHNLIIHHTSRTPRLGPRPGTQTDERMDMRNNVIYNFGGNGCYGGEGMNVNIVNNYYKPGPGSPSGDKGMRIAAPGIRTTSYTGHGTNPNSWDVMWHVWGKYYVNGNVNTKYDQVTKDNWTYGIYNQIDASGNDGTYTQATKDTIKLAEPIHFLATTTHTAEKAFEKVLQYVGASLHRDALDDIMVSDARDGKATFTGNGNGSGFINSQDDVKSKIPNGWPDLVQGTVLTDTDGDGMPDEWEDAHGLNKNNKNDGNATGEGGYTNLEIYMNSLVAHITEDQYEGGTLMGEKLSWEAAAVKYTIDTDTHVSDTKGNWTFQDGITVTTGSSDTYANTYSDQGNGFIRFGKAQYTVTVPTNVTISEVTFTGYSNVSGTKSYISELGGKDFGDTYVLPSRSETSHKIMLPEAAKGEFTFTISGANRNLLKLELTGVTTQTTGIEEVSTFPVTRFNDGAFYNLQGVRVDNPTKGLYIQNGKKIFVR